MIGNQGTPSTVSIQYDRPWRGGNDNNFNDQVTQTSGSPLAIEVFEGPLLTVTPTASATTVPAGSTVSFSATYEPSNVSGVTYNWSFDGGAANSTASAPTVTFNTGGTYKVTVQVSDDEGGGGAGRFRSRSRRRRRRPSNHNGPPSGPDQQRRQGRARFRASIRVATGAGSQREPQQRVHWRSALELADVGEPQRDDARPRPRGLGPRRRPPGTPSPAVTPPATTQRGPAKPQPAARRLT